MVDLIEREPLLAKMFPCAAKKQVEEAPTVNRWIPVEEALPEIDKDVLVYAVRKDGLGNAVTTITQYINHIWFGHRIDTEPYWRDPWQYFHSDYEITHWMYLPEPPESEVQE